MRRRLEIPMHGMLFGPVVVAAQEALCAAWISRRLDIALDPSRPLADALVSGRVLCFLLGFDPWLSGDEGMAPWPLAERNLHMFVDRAPDVIDAGAVFDVGDLLYRRNVPRVLRTVAEIARVVDAEGFEEVAAEIGGARARWSAAEEVDEVWVGDWLLRQLVLSFRRLSWSGGLGIVVAGTQGSGKSATIDSLFGRKFMPSSHNMGFIPADEEFDGEEREVIMDYRRASALNWPGQLFERDIPLPSTAVCKMYTKVAGVEVKVVKIPSMESRLMAISQSGVATTFVTGIYHEVQNDVQRDAVHVLLLVERLDALPLERFRGVCKKVHRLYGDKVWTRAVVVLTHGACLPPDGLSFEELVARRSHEVVCCIRDVAGDKSVAVPTVVVENSSSCPRDEDTGLPVLPNGAEFHVRLLNTMEFILAKHQGADALRPIAPRRWWEDYAIVGLGIFLLSRL